MTQGRRPALPYRPGVGLMLFNGDGLVFVGQRINVRSVGWQMPQGGIKEGETPQAAALRELAEEVGTERAEIVAEARGWISYDLPEEFMGTVWGGRYRGQRQKWFAMRFTGTDGDIDVRTKKPEFRAWKWVEIDDLLDLVVPFKRRVYEEVVAEFRQIVKGGRSG